MKIGEQNIVEQSLLKNNSSVLHSQSNNHTDQGQGMMMIHSAQGQQFNKTLTNMMQAGP